MVLPKLQEFVSILHTNREVFDIESVITMGTVASRGRNPGPLESLMTGLEPRKHVEYHSGVSVANDDSNRMAMICNSVGRPPRYVIRLLCSTQCHTCPKHGLLAWPRTTDSTFLVPDRHQWYGELMVCLRPVGLPPLSLPRELANANETPKHSSLLDA